ncbi:unnamed protein product, partial [Ectocarpus sp. 12 AP-2014]
RHAPHPAWEILFHLCSSLLVRRESCWLPSGDKQSQDNTILMSHSKTKKAQQRGGGGGEDGGTTITTPGATHPSPTRTETKPNQSTHVTPVNSPRAATCMTASLVSHSRLAFPTLTRVLLDPNRKHALTPTRHRTPHGRNEPSLSATHRPPFGNALGRT